MAKATKPKKKKGKYDITVNIKGITPDELLKMAINTPVKNKKKQ